MGEMTDERAADVLAAHNEWRRFDGETGAPGAPEMCDPTEIGRAIDHAVSRLRSQPAAVDEAQSEAIRARRQQIAGWLEGLSQAARSLRTIAEQAGRTEGMEDMQDVRGYANSRATVAEAALGFQQGGRSDD